MLEKANSIVIKLSFTGKLVVKGNLISKIKQPQQFVMQTEMSNPHLPINFP